MYDEHSMQYMFFLKESIYHTYQVFKSVFYTMPIDLLVSYLDTQELYF